MLSSGLLMQEGKVGLGMGGGRIICSWLTSHVGLADCACKAAPWNISAPAEK